MNEIEPLKVDEKLFWATDNDYWEIDNLIKDYEPQLYIDRTNVAKLFFYITEKLNELVRECNELRSIIEQAGLSSAKVPDATPAQPNQERDDE